MTQLVAGVDFGSDSVRVVIVETRTGKTVSDAVRGYPRWQKGLYCDSSRKQFRQHPLDYIESFESAMLEALCKAGAGAGDAMLGIAFDTTGSTPCAVNREGTPLALLPEFSENPNAMFHLWKDHTAVEEAKEINNVFVRGDVDYTQFQGIYSSEWYWAKILHTSRADARVRAAAWSWVEHSDWMPALLTGNTAPETMYRCACGAGHKALWHSAFGGLPSRERLRELDPCLEQAAKHYGGPPRAADSAAGVISAEWAGRLGVNPRAIVGGSSFDAHAGAVGAGIGAGTMVKVIGTSTVDMLVERQERLSGKDLRACCGLAENSILPGYVGIEASQAAFGDVYAWLRNLMLWPLLNMNVVTDERLTDQLHDGVLAALEREAAKLPDTDELIALDWFNGRRYPELNENVCGAIAGLTLGSTAPGVYRALVMATVFGSKRILDSLLDSGVQIDRLIAVGGIARKSAYVMQRMADALGRPIMVCSEKQVCARGAAIYAAVGAGVFANVPAAQEVFCEPYRASYFPDENAAARCREIYKKYRKLGEYAEETCR